LFRKRQVLVNFWPFVMDVLSGMVTSSTMTALSLQGPTAASVEPGPGVAVVSPLGVVVIDGSAVEDNSVRVGNIRAGRVGGRVAVTNWGGWFVGTCDTRFAQAERTRPASRIHVLNILIQ
jgi:hypothetical protein